MLNKIAGFILAASLLGIVFVSNAEWTRGDEGLFLFWCIVFMLGSLAVILRGVLRHFYIRHLAKR